MTWLNVCLVDGGGVFIVLALSSFSPRRLSFLECLSGAAVFKLGLIINYRRRKGKKAGKETSGEEAGHLLT